MNSIVLNAGTNPDAFSIVRISDFEEHT